MSFVADLQKGKEIEREFAKYLLQDTQVKSIEFPQGKFKEYDIKVTYNDGKEKTYELKRDLKAHETGNFVIEARYGGVASGIYASKADYIVHYVLDKWWIQDRAELILRLNEVEKKVTKGGDGFKSTLYIIKADKLPELCEEIIMNNEQDK